MIHLRFLDLSDTQINHLPDSICTLYTLETLLLSNCRFLKFLPTELGKLILLVRLDLSGTNLEEMPMHRSRLKEIQQLTTFVVGKCNGSGINELKELQRLRGTISISGLQNVTSSRDASEAKMTEKKHIEKLALKWGGTTEDSQNERDILEKLEHHTNLKHLEIRNYGGTRFPTWLGDQSFCNMVSLRLENCEFCFFLPPLGQIPSLKVLTIARLPGITSVGHEFYGESLSKPFQSLERLRFEEMAEWVDWCTLGAGEFSRLQKLHIIKCPKLIRDLPKKVPSFVRLEIEKCPKLVASLPMTTSIRELVLRECQGIQLERQAVSSVETLEISGYGSLKEFASELVTLTSLKYLRMRKCTGLLSFMDTGFPPMLTRLSVRDCEVMQCFPRRMMRLNYLKELSVSRCLELVLPLNEKMSHCYTTVEQLYLDGCQNLKSHPLGLFPKLRNLAIRCCINFEILLIPDGIELQNLAILNIEFCHNMVCFPRGGLPAPKLSCLWVEGCKKLKALPEQMHTLLPSLQSLWLWDCSEIESFPEGVLPSTTLSTLNIRDCKIFVGGRRDWGLQALPSLTRFTLCGEYEDMESFPEEGLLPSTLTSIDIVKLPNLKSLNKRGLQLLGSLEYMEIKSCPQLQSLPEEGLPTSLFELHIDDCPLLKPHCRREEGDDWHKVAHIRVLIIHGEAIFD